MRRQAGAHATRDELDERRVGEDEPVAQGAGRATSRYSSQRVCVSIRRSHGEENTPRGGGFLSTFASSGARERARARSAIQTPSAAAATAMIHARPPSRAEKTAIASSPAASSVNSSPSARRCTRGAYPRPRLHSSRSPRGVAQLVEHRSPKPGVAGSSPVSPAGFAATRPRPLPELCPTGHVSEGSSTGRLRLLGEVDPGQVEVLLRHAEVGEPLGDFDRARRRSLTSASRPLRTNETLLR